MDSTGWELHAQEDSVCEKSREQVEEKKKPMATENKNTQKAAARVKQEQSKLRERQIAGTTERGPQIRSHFLTQ